MDRKRFFLSSNGGFCGVLWRYILTFGGARAVLRPQRLREILAPSFGLLVGRRRLFFTVSFDHRCFGVETCCVFRFCAGGNAYPTNPRRTCIRRVDNGSFVQRGNYCTSFFFCIQW